MLLLTGGVPSDRHSGPYDGIVEDVCLAAPQNQKIWRKEGEKDTKMAVKCYYKDEIVIFRGEAIRYAQVRSLSLRQSIVVCRR
jgi:hypothetical protein